MIKIGNVKVFSVKEIAEKFGLTPLTIRKYIKQGRLKGAKMGQKWYIAEQAILEFFMQTYSPEKQKKTDGPK